MQFTFDPDKNAANIVKHGLSLTDAPLVFNAPEKLTVESPKAREARLMDVALVEVAAWPPGRQNPAPQRRTFAALSLAGFSAHCEPNR